MSTTYWSLPPGPGAERRDQRGPDHHTDRVRRDDVPRRRDVDVYAVGDLRQQPHRDELGGSNREPTGRQGQQGKADMPGDTDPTVSSQ